MKKTSKLPQLSTVSAVKLPSPARGRGLRRLPAAYALLLILVDGLASASTVQPGLGWVRYLGGAAADVVGRAARDSEDNIWVAGATADPTTWQPGLAKVVHLGAGGGGDAFVARLNAEGDLTLLVFIGGRGGDSALSLACTVDGGVVVGGGTDSVDFPTTPGALQRNLRGGTDAWVAKLNGNGDLQWATLLGGTSSDVAFAVAAMTDGSTVVGGSTWSPDFPVVDPLQGPGPPGQPDGFVAVLAPAGGSLAFSTHLGGSSSDEVRDLAVDSQGNIIAVGQTASPDFPVYRAYQSSLAGATLCGGDAFVVKLAWPSREVIFSTYLGGSQEDAGESVAVDASGRVTVVGTTLSANFPWVPGSYLGPLGAFNLFVTRMASDGSSLISSARLPLTATAGGPGCAPAPQGFGVALGATGQSWAVGPILVANFPVVNALQGQLGGPSDGFISALTPDGKALAFSTFLGGSAADALRAITVSSAGDVFVAGVTQSSDLPASLGSYQGGGDVFVARISTTTVVLSSSAAAIPVSGLAPLDVSFSGRASGGTGLYTFSWDFGDGSPHASERNPTHTYMVGGSYNATLTVTDSAGARAAASVSISVAHNCSLACSASAPLVVAAGQWGSFSASATPSDCVGAANYLWTFGDGQTSTEQSPPHAYTAPGLYTWSLQASVGSVTCTRSGTIAVAAAPVHASYSIPAVAHKPGYFGTQWRTDVTVVNLLTSPAPASLTLVFRCAGCAPRFGTTMVQAGTSMEWCDILTSFFQQPDTTSASGALQIYSDRPVVITARTYNQTATGTLGASYPALTASDGLTSGQNGVLAGLKRNAAYRTNIGAVNLGSAPCTVLVTLLGSGGTQLGSPMAIEFDPGSWRQLDDVFIASGAGVQDLAYATVVVQTPGGRAWVYASVVDNATGDPTTVPVVVP